MQVTKTGSVRVDLLGGTLDLDPIHVILPHVVTLNVATTLKAQVKLESTDFAGIHIVSVDYKHEEKIAASELSFENLYIKKKFKELQFVLQIFDYFGLKSGIKVELQSGSPAGAGLGGSSAMGVTLFSALCDWSKKAHSKTEQVRATRAIEARILNRGPAGYQDYYPALFGGVLALHGRPGEVGVEQLYDPGLKNFLENHLTLIYSGETRNSGINNWEVYKGFFDQDSTRQGLAQIAELSYEAYQHLKNQQHHEFLSLIGEEGRTRAKLFPGIVSSKMKSFMEEAEEKITQVGFKVCGAGGGGCFLVTHPSEMKGRVEKMAQTGGMEVLKFQVDAPL